MRFTVRSNNRVSHRGSESTTPAWSYNLHTKDPLCTCRKMSWHSDNKNDHDLPVFWARVPPLSRGG